jgi:hypothetical protein
MAKKKAKKSSKPRIKATEWSMGQPLIFPKKKAKPDDFQNARHVVEHAVGEPLVPPKRTAKDPLKTKRQPAKKGRK